MQWREAVAYFKGREDPHLVLMLRDEPMLQRLLTAWPVICRDFDSEVFLDAAPMNALDAILWEWVWAQRFREHTGIPWEEWGRVAKVNAVRHRHLMERVIALRMIYPDGTVHGTCLGYLHKMAAKALG
jgi:hypothetical protein